MFVFLIFVLLVMIVLDRALYLRKSVKWKLVYQLFTISLLHIWIFGALPGITKTEAAQNRVSFSGRFERRDALFRLLVGFMSLSVYISSSLPGRLGMAIPSSVQETF